MIEGKKAEYKNAVRSRQLIKNAYVALLNEKNVDKITVTDIIGKAGISRGTFYAHFADVHDLYFKIENEVITAVLNIIEEISILNFFNNPLPTLEINLLHLENNKDYYRLLLSSCIGCSFIQKLSDEIAGRFVPQVTEYFSAAKTETVRSYINFISSGVRGMLFHWLDNNLHITASECASLMSEMILGARPAEMRQ